MTDIEAIVEGLRAAQRNLAQDLDDFKARVLNDLEYLKEHLDEIEECLKRRGITLNS